MELDPRARSLLQLDSLRSERFSELSQHMIKFIDAIVTFVGPDIEDYADELMNLGEDYSRSVDKGGVGFDEELFPVLAESICAGFRYHLKDAFTEETEEAWSSVLEYVVTTMESAGGIM